MHCILIHRCGERKFDFGVGLALKQSAEIGPVTSERFVVLVSNIGDSQRSGWLTSIENDINILIKSDTELEVRKIKESLADLLLHPVRLRMIRTLVGGRTMTAQQISEELSDVPHATLYRHLNKLHQAGILIVVDQNQVRGTVEKVYALAEHKAQVTADDFATATRDEHMRYFITFLAGLMNDYQRYLRQAAFDLEEDGVSYRQAPLYLSNEEFTQFRQQLSEIILKAMKNGPAPGRRKRTLTTIIIPEPARTEEQD